MDWVAPWEDAIEDGQAELVVVVKGLRLELPILTSA
jgi:hypothetical protein